MKKTFATFALVVSLTLFLPTASASAVNYKNEAVSGDTSAFSEGTTKSPPPATPSDPNAFVGPNVTAPTSFVSRIQECIDTGNCSLCDVLKFFGTIAQWILATVGALALLFFVLGGFDLLTSAGKQEADEKGKKKIVGALIGLLIVLGAYFIINTVLTLAIGDPGGSAKIKTSKGSYDWYNISCK